MIEQVALLGSSVINFFGRKLSTSTTTEQQKFKTNTTENLHREHSNPPSSETAMRSSWLCAFFISCVIIVLLGLALFVACMASEIRRAKKKDIKFDGKLCYLPGSRAFTYGIAALLCLSAAQIIGNLIICKIICLGEKRDESSNKKPIGAKVLLVLSWVSCGLAIVLLAGAASMSREQAYREGWLDRECYLVKDGVYLGSGVLVLVTIAPTLGSAMITIRRAQNERSRKLQSQAG